MGVGRGGPRGPGSLNQNTTNGKKGAKKALFFSVSVFFSRLRAQQYTRTTIINNNIDKLGGPDPVMQFLPTNLNVLLG